jgi:hypothetical protein
MSSRFLISVLCVGAVAFACGPRARNEATTPRKNTVLAQAASELPIARQQGLSRASLTTDKDSNSPVAAQLYVRKNESDIRFALHIQNTSKKRLEIKFANGQTYDFVVLDSTGREMWRWGSARMFTQALRNKLLRAGESLEFEESMKEIALPPGRYIARATLTSTNYPLVQEAEFTVSGSTLASR